MTANELLKLACDMCGEGPEDYASVAVAFINATLADSYGYEQGMRQYKGITPLIKMPVVTALTDEIPYDDDLQIGLAYKMCAKIFAEDDLNKSAFWDNQAVIFFNRNQKPIIGRVVNMNFPDE